RRHRAASCRRRARPRPARRASGPCGSPRPGRRCTAARCRTAGPRGAPHPRASGGRGGTSASRSCRLAELEARDPADLDVLAGRGCQLGDEVADGLRLILDVRLVHEHRGGLRGLLVAVLLEERLDLVVLQQLPAHVLRRHRRDLHRDRLRELAELRVAGDEVRLARELDERPDASTTVDVRLDDALLRRAVATLRGGREAPLLEDRLRLLEVALRGLEGLLAVHDAGPGLRPKALDVARGCHGYFSSVVPDASAAGAASASSLAGAASPAPPAPPPPPPPPAGVSPS